MRNLIRSLASVCAVLTLMGSLGCGDSSGPAVGAGPDGENQPPETLDQRRTRWTTENAGRPRGVPATFELSGNPIHISGAGRGQVDSGVLATGPLFPDDKHYLFFADAQVGAEKGLLVLEGQRIQIAGGTLGQVELGAVSTRTHLENGTASPAVELSTAYATGGTKPDVTFPEDWSDAKSALFFSDPTSVSPGNLLLTGFTRGILVTATGNTALSGSVTITSAGRMYWDGASHIEVTSSTLEYGGFALGGKVSAGSLTSSELAAAPPLPSAVMGLDAKITVQPGTVRSADTFRLTQAVTEQGLLIPSELEVSYDATPLTLKKSQRGLVPVIFREKTLRGQAVLSDLQVTGSGKEAVRVALGEVETTVEQLWDSVGEAGIAAPFLALPIAIVTPFLALGEWLSCAFSTCPKAFPVWMETGTVSRFHIIVQGELPPGSYEANVTLTGRNYAPFTVPVRFTITE
ncbi:MAG TPA: hypothetical protein VNA24_21250 [Hyalangium sp.]|nr:hypothetical protein [Hyalangium sp.]